MLIFGSTFLKGYVLQLGYISLASLAIIYELRWFIEKKCVRNVEAIISILLKT